MMFISERFIALDIILVSTVPEAPTKEPTTMSKWFSKTKPVIAAAKPENAFSSEMTTGMSAPPIGRTIRTPSRSDNAPTIQNAIMTGIGGSR